VTFAGWLEFLVAVRALLARELGRGEERDDLHDRSRRVGEEAAPLTRPKPGREPRARCRAHRGADVVDPRSILDEIDALVSVKGRELAGAIETVEALLRATEPTAEPFERARILLALGRVRRRAKQRKQAREALAEALALFEQTGSPAWAEATRAEVARCGERGPEGELTVSERRVAEFVAQGMSNREIATAAFISPKTVEANLARVYRKLGIRSRAQLAVHIALQTAGSPSAIGGGVAHTDGSLPSSVHSVGISPIDPVTVSCNHDDCTRRWADATLPPQSV
jgi:DNA-binding CsgD family transcriptional regulator